MPGAGPRRQPPELPGPVQADEDLAEQPLHAGRLAAGSQRLDGGVGHDLGRIGDGERPLVEALGWGEQAAPRDHVRVAGPTRNRGQADVRPGPRAGRHGRPGRHELDDPGRGIVRIRQPRDGNAIPGRRATDRDRGERLHPTIDELDDPTIAGHDRLHGRERRD